MSALRQKSGETQSAPVRSKARGSAAFQLSVELGTSRCSLQAGSRSSAREGLLPNVCACENPWPYGAGSRGGEWTGTVTAFGSKDSGSGSNTDTLRLQSVWARANFMCVRKLQRVGFLDLPQSQHHVIILGKKWKKKGPLICPYPAKELTGAVSR